MRIALVLALAVLSPIAASLPVSGSWDVAGETVIEGQTLVIAQDVNVLPGAALRLHNVDALVARSATIRVHDGGVLELASSRLAGVLPFTVLVNGTLYANASSASNGALRVAGIAIIDGGNYDAATGNLLEVTGISLVTNATLAAPGGEAAFVTQGGALSLRFVSVGQTGDYGVASIGGSLTIENATFGAAPEYAVFAQRSVVAIGGTSFGRHCGAFLIEQTTGSFTANDVHTVDHGVTLVNSNVTVTGNTFSGTQIAVLVTSGSPTVHNNSFVGNFVAVHNYAAAPIDARWNWWGSPAGPAASDTIGAVTTAPWLLAAP